MTSRGRSPQQRLAGRVAVITGGAGGIGLATARRLIAEGAQVAIWDVLLGEGIEALRSDVPAGIVQTAQLDVRDRAAVCLATTSLLETAGRTDILVNNAGVNPGAVELSELSERVWRVVLDTNLKGAMLCAQAVAPAMKQRRWGRIVNLGSVLAHFGIAGQSAYAASKAALVTLTRVWAHELGPFGITVNAVSPGYIQTAANAGNPNWLVAQVLARTAVGRLGEPEDVAAAIAYLCSDEAGFVNGAVIPVDGGLVP